MNFIIRYVVTFVLVAVFAASSTIAFSQSKLNVKFDTIEKHNSFYIYKLITNLVAAADTQQIFPKHFQIQLPKNMRTYRTSGLNQFAFYYPKGQCIFVFIELRHQIIADTSYSPVNKEIEDIIYKKVSNTWSLKENNMQTNLPNNKRKIEVIKKDAATILLYNILPKNYESFKSNTSQFRFL